MIGDFSCSGSSSADDSGAGACRLLKRSVEVGDYACIGQSACVEARYLDVADSACTGSNACAHAEDSIIGFASCVGEEACESLDDAVIGERSCHGGKAVNCPGSSSNGACYKWCWASWSSWVIMLATVTVLVPKSTRRQLQSAMTRAWEHVRVETVSLSRYPLDGSPAFANEHAETLLMRLLLLPSGIEVAEDTKLANRLRELYE